jgi:tetratricopeptide (TPR) repeat protein
MMEGMARLRPWANLALALALMLGWVLACQHLRRMDRVFFQPSPAGAWALVHYLAGDYVGAARAYRAHYRNAVAVGWSSGDPALDALLGGDVDRAATVARSGASGERAFLLAMADVALERGRPDEALAPLRRALARAPDDVEALLLASLAHARRDEPGEAIAALDRALRQNSIGSRPTTFTRMLETTGALGGRQGRERRPCLLAHFHRYLRVLDPSAGRRAIAYAEEAIRAADRPADAYLALGSTLDSQGQRDRALSAFLQAVTIDPHDAEAYRRAASIYAQRGDVLDEYRLARAALETSPADPFYLARIDHLLTERLGDPHETIAVMGRVIDRDPRDVTAHDRLARALSFIGEPTRAVSHYEAAIRLAPDDPALHEGLGQALERLDRSDEAIAAYRRAAELAPQRYQPHTALAGVYQGQRRDREAIAEYETALRLGEPSPETHAALCALYHAASERTHAADCFRTVLARDPDNPLARRALAEAPSPGRPLGEANR